MLFVDKPIARCYAEKNGILIGTVPMALFEQALGIRQGLNCIIGGGGKSTLLKRLGMELSSMGPVILCATTKMYPPPGVPFLQSPTAAQLKQALQSTPLLCVGDCLPDGKITLSATPISLLLGHAPYVLAEADGAKGLPLKAHAPHEPVLPAKTARTILVLGLDGIGMPIAEAAHRPALYGALLGMPLTHPVTPEDAAAVIAKEGFGDILFANKVETATRKAYGEQLIQYAPMPVVVASLHVGEVLTCS